MKQVSMMVWLVRLVLLFLAQSWACAASSDHVAASAMMAEDGRAFSITSPGLILFRAGFSAIVEIGGATQELSSAAGSMGAPVVRSAETTPYGQADVIETTFHFGRERVDLLFRLGRVPGVSGMLVQAGVLNAGNAPLKLLSVSPIMMDGAGPTGRAVRAGCGLQPDGSPEDWLITGLHASMSAVTALSEVRGPLTVHESGGLYRKDGTGFLFGPVGVPTAYVNGQFSPTADGRILFNVSADMSGAQVDPGETRWGQQVVLLMDAPHRAVACWAKWVGKTHGARLSKGALSGWNNLNFRTNQDVTRELRDIVNTVRQSDGRLRPEVIQIDDGRQSVREALDAPWLPELRRGVAETGARFGMRLGFDRNVKPPDPDAATGVSDITGTVRRAVQEGFTYLKVHCPPVSQREAGEKRTSFEMQRDDWAAIRKAAGEGTYILSCDREPNRAVVGSVDASRIGPDAKRRDLRKIIDCVLRSYQLQGRWFAVDNDLYYMVSESEGRSRLADGGQIVRTWISMAGLSCGAAISFDLWYKPSFRPCWRNIEILTPPARERTEVLGLCTDPEWTTLVAHVRRKWSNSTVVLLWNPDEAERVITLDFAQAGLDPERRYAVWSFWDNRFLGVVKGTWRSQMLAPSGSELLCFTDMEQAKGRPMLIGSSLHIYCGAADIKRITSSRDTMEIELTDAGARAGDLFVYSRRQPILKTSVGCAVTDVAEAGENVWRIGISNRQHDALQRVELSILLPMSRQSWFRLLVATLGVSVAFAVWRYVAGLKLARQLALNLERARIAEDLHDDLGSELAGISMMAAIAESCASGSPEVRARLHELADRSQKMVRRLEEIVWAINPANDTVERFADYFCKFAQEYLEVAGVRSRFDVPGRFLSRSLSSTQRHNLFLAAKEALHNAIRHGSPAEVTIRIVQRPGRLEVTVEDDGVGFVDTPSLRSGRGSGNMSARMHRIGGTFERRSAPGRGTAVILSTPL